MVPGSPHGGKWAVGVGVVRCTTVSVAVARTGGLEWELVDAVALERTRAMEAMPVGDAVAGSVAAGSVGTCSHRDCGWRAGPMGTALKTEDVAVDYIVVVVVVVGMGQAVGAGNSAVGVHVGKVAAAQTLVAVARTEARPKMQLCSDLDPDTAAAAPTAELAVRGCYDGADPDLGQATGIVAVGSWKPVH